MLSICIGEHVLAWLRDSMKSNGRIYRVFLLFLHRSHYADPTLRIAFAFIHTNGENFPHGWSRSIGICHICRSIVFCRLERTTINISMPCATMELDLHTPCVSNEVQLADPNIDEENDTSSLKILQFKNYLVPLRPIKHWQNDLRSALPHICAWRVSVLTDWCHALFDD